MYMKKNKLMALAISATLLVGGSIALAACKNKEDSNEKEADVASSATRSSGNNASSGSNSSSANATVELLKLTDKDQETSYDEATAQKIELSDNCGKINITKEGTYIVTGSTNNGMIIINVNSEEDVHLILRDATIVSESSAAIYVMSADEVYITLEGEIRMTNRTENGCRNIHVFCYVKEYAIFEDEYWDVMSDHNTVELEGYICKKPRYRQTSYSNKEITDLLVANNRRNNKSFYIPCIAWGLLAKMASKFKEGDKITLKGRFQSRRYKADPLNGKLKDYSIQEISIQQVTLAEEAEEPKIA